MKTKGRVNRRSDRIPRFADRRLRVPARISSREIKRGTTIKPATAPPSRCSGHGSRARAEYQRESDGLKAARDPHLSPGLSRAQVKGKRERASGRASERTPRRAARRRDAPLPLRSASLCVSANRYTRARHARELERASARKRVGASEGCLGVILSRVFSGGGERARQRDRGKSRLLARGREGKRQGGRGPGSACAPN